MPKTRSPGAKPSARDSTTSARPPERITSPIATGGIYCGTSFIHTRLVGSTDRNRVRATTAPSSTAGGGDSSKAKSSIDTRPSGRRASFSWRLTGVTMLAPSDDSVEPVAQPAFLRVGDALADALQAVEPGIARIAGLVSRAGIDSVEAVGAEADAAAIFGIDQRAVVGAKGRPDVERADA